MTILDPARLVSLLVAKMRQQATAANVSCCEVDISGGVDSATTAALSVRAFGPQNVIGVYSSVQSSPDSRRRAREVAKRFGFPLVELDLSSVYEQIVAQVEQEFIRLGLNFPSRQSASEKTVFGGLRSCLRAPVGRFINRAFGGGIRQGTGNLDEDEFLRFYQKGGDGEVDANWIGGLYKSEVWQLAEHLGVPECVIDAMPTPDLWADNEVHTDESELETIAGIPLTYTRPGEELGSIEWASRENARNGCIVGENATVTPQQLGYDEAQSKIIEAIRRFERATRHKAELPPVVAREELLQAGVVK